MLHLAKPKVAGLFENWLLLLLVVLMLIAALWPELAQAQSATPTSAKQPGPALVVTIQNKEGQPLVGLDCEVLSLDWGRAAGQPYGVIARGQTDELGQVSFELEGWFRIGNYYLKVTTPQNQSVSLPLELIAAQSYRLRLVLNIRPGNTELQLTEAGKEASAATAGSNSVRAIPQATFLAQVVAQDRTRAVTDLVRPADSTTQQARQTSAVTPLPNTGEVGAGQTSTAPSTSSGSLGEAFVLAVVGVVSLLAFVRYRKQFYGWLGLPGGQPPAFKRKPDPNSTPRQLAKAEKEPNTNSVPRGQK